MGHQHVFVLRPNLLLCLLAVDRVLTDHYHYLSLHHGHGHDDEHKESVHGDCEEEAKNGGCCAKIGLFMCSFNDKYMKPFLIYKYTAEHQEVQDEFAELIQRD